jgi:hypothetical protein
MTILNPSPRPGHDGRDAAKPDPRAGTLTLPGTLAAARLKVTIAGDVIAEAGLRAQPKAAKPAQQRPVAGNDHRLWASVGKRQPGGFHAVYAKESTRSPRPRSCCTTAIGGERG